MTPSGGVLSANDSANGIGGLLVGRGRDHLAKRETAPAESAPAESAATESAATGTDSSAAT